MSLFISGKKHSEIVLSLEDDMKGKELLIKAKDHTIKKFENENKRIRDDVYKFSRENDELKKLLEAKELELQNMEIKLSEVKFCLDEAKKENYNAAMILSKDISLATSIKNVCCDIGNVKFTKDNIFELAERIG